ncbi:MAG: HlyD family efflux transporter periplasmic adaptor subunit, partial [Gemmataceae bacterium]|nr:HlyD family efflux transporter periplasmic adaptor subunit [Gemmataceae bacterium]
LFNFLPLLKLDGYYLVSDWLEIPNLHQRALASFKGHVRRLLWGAPKPDPEPHGRLLLGFGLATWLYSAGLLVATLWIVGHFLGERRHWLALGAVMLLGFFALRSLLQGFAAGEVTNMFLLRHKRTVVWLTVLLGLPLTLALVKIEDRASGPFRLRPARSVEVRATVAGFVKEVYCEEGTRIASGEIVARLEAPDLESRLTQKQAEVSEVGARLRLLEVGARPEEVLEQRQRVKRATAWRDLAQKDLTLTKQALAEDLDRLEQQIKAGSAELNVARDALERANTLAGARSIAASELRDAQGKSLVSQARLAEAQAAKRALQLKGTMQAQVELARREQALAEAQALLRLLEAGVRPQEIEAELARMTRLCEEVRRLQEQKGQLAVVALAHGVVTTTRMKDKVGQYLREGDLICVLEEPGDLEAEIAIAEQDIARIQPGQEVALKARALAFDTFRTRVERIAPAAGPGEGQSCVKVFCRLGDYPADLRPEMTGHARIYTGRRPIGAIVVDRALRWLRTEFWW